MKNLILLLLLIPFFSFSQIIATVDENGKKVVLNSDGALDVKKCVQNKKK